jgi:alpha-L-arabinofuranosidase
MKNQFNQESVTGSGIVRMYMMTIAALILWCAGTGNAIAQQSGPSFTVDVSKPGVPVAPVCRGQQIEEFNYQIEGGLYAQLINNPSFEEIDTKLNDNPAAYWTLVKSGNSDGKFSAQTAKQTIMLNAYQRHCMKLEVLSLSSGNVGLANSGYWGIKLVNGTKYKVSFWARRGENFKGSIIARLEGNDGKVYARSAELRPTGNWQHFTCDLTAGGITKVSGENRLVLYATSAGDVYFDVITLMPPTWKNRPNGLRPDLAEMLAALEMKFIQFPGGCTAESYTMDTCWNWKNSVGPIEERAGSTRSRWAYKNDLFFGLDEYLQLSEDLGAEPVYVTSAGISETPQWGPYGLCPIDKMQPIIDDILDLLEYCKGPVTSKWGAKRAANGHPSPYGLKYIEIGNENGWQTIKEYIPRYTMIHDAIMAKYPDLKIMFNSSNVPESASAGFLDYVDDHYYEKNLAHMYNKYDSINPAWKKVCVAEYASSVNGNGGNVIGNYGDALGDAVFMLGCEKNSERIWWTGYGNYAGFLGHGNFGPCIVWNDAVSCFATPSYYMQKMLFTDNAGTKLLPFEKSSTGCYWSASLDTRPGKNDILIKVVNNGNKAETVKINLKGAININIEGVSETMKGHPEDENTIADPKKIYPSEGKFRAGSGFDYTFPAYSATVLRIRMAKAK